MKVAAIKVNWTEAYALLGKCAVSNLMPWYFWKKLELAPTDTDRQVNLADGTIFEVVGLV